MPYSATVALAGFKGSAPAAAVVQSDIREMMNTIARTALAAALLVPGLAWAQASNFNFIEASYQQGEVNDLDVDGWNLEASLEVAPQVFVEGFYSKLSLDESIPGFDIDARAMGFGLGYIFGQTDFGNVYGTIGYVDVNNRLTVGGRRVRDNDDGFSLGLGTRFNLSQQAELRLEADYTEIDSDDSFEVSAALLYSFSPQLAGFAEFSRDSDSHAVGVGMRFYFR